MKVFANNIDVTDYVSKNSIRVMEQMNNRANTCGFKVDEYQISEGSKIELFESFFLTEEAVSGQPVLNVNDTFQFEGKFQAGDEIILDIKGAAFDYATILSVDHTAKTITLTANIVTTVPVGSHCGRLVFSGVTMRNPDEEIGMTGSFSYSLTATDWTKIFDNKNIADTYENQYSREMLGRILYGFVANDSEVTLDLFESAWTHSGNALAMSADTADKIQGTNSMQTGVSASGTSLWTKTVTAIDMSDMDRFRLWFKIGATYGVKVTSIKFRIGSDSSNYFEGVSGWTGKNNEDCWNFEAFDTGRVDTVGTPDKSSITWLQIEFVTTASIPSGQIHFDHALATEGGFILNSSIRGDRKFVDVRVQYKKPTVFVDSLARLQNFFWYIDYEKDLHFFKMDATPAPFSLDDTSENFSDLSITTDISSVKNRQVVRGGEAVDAAPYSQTHECDGVETSYSLDYKPKSLVVSVDTGSGFVTKTVGIENLDDPTAFDFLFNFNEKVVRNSTIATLNAGDLIKFEYYPFKPIRVRVVNQSSVDAMKALLGGDGIFDGAVINDTSIRDWAEARTRARAEVDAYSNPIVSADFSTQQDGLFAGQIIHITDTSRGIDSEFLIQKISKASRNDDRWTYNVSCGSTMFGIIEFFQLLLKKTESLEVDISEIVDIVLNDDETIAINPVYVLTKKEAPFKATSNLTKWFDFSYEVGTFDTEKRMIFSGKNSGFTFIESGTEVGEVEFDTSSNYNGGKSMKMTTTIGGTGQILTVKSSIRIPVIPAANFAFSVWYEILTALTGSGGFSVDVKQYAAVTGGAVLATTSLLSDEKNLHSYNRTRQTFTTHASANFIEIELKIDDAVGTVSIGEMLLEDLTTESSSLPAVASFSETI